MYCRKSVSLMINVTVSFLTRSPALSYIDAQQILRRPEYSSAWEGALLLHRRLCSSEILAFHDKSSTRSTQSASYRVDYSKM